MLSPMMAPASEQEPRIGRRHVVLADMHAVGFRSERNVDAIVDEQRDALGLQHGLERARLLDHGAGRAMLVAQLHQRRAACDATGQIGKRTAAGNRRVDKGIKPEIDIHQLTFARAMSVGPSRL